MENARATPPVSPREFTVEVVKAKFACELNAEWHSRLPYIHWSNVVRNTHYICFAAKYGDEYYATGIWSSPVAQNRFTYGKQMLELRRMAVSEGCPKNTATWMLGQMRKYIAENMPDIAMLISYQDTEVHVGTIYKADNWEAVSTSQGQSWTTEKRTRNKEQTLATKVRWERKIKAYVEPQEVKD